MPRKQKAMFNTESQYLHRPKETRDHIAQEYMTLGKDEDAKSITFALMPWARQRVLKEVK